MNERMGRICAAETGTCGHCHEASRPMPGEACSAGGCSSWLAALPPCATRREFLKATSILAASAVLASLELDRLALAADDAGTNTKMLRIRGHHLFDMLDALGTGKSAHKTLGPVASMIRATPKAPLQLVVGVDDICGPCEWWDHEKGLCKRDLKTHPEDNANSLTSDKNAIRVLGMKPGDTAPAVEVYRQIQAKVTKKVFAEEVCVACRLVNECQKTYEPKIEAAVKALAQPKS